MNLFSLIAFFACLVYIAFGAFALRRDPHAPLNRLFFAASLANAVWAFGYTFLYPAAEPSTQWFWYRFSAFGWCTLPSFSLHFALLLTGRERLLARRWVTALLYAPAVLLLWRALTGVLLAQSFQPGPLGVVEIHAVGSPWYFLYTVYIVGFMTLAAGLVLRWGRRTGVPRFRRQARLIGWSFAAGIVGGVFTNLVVPLTGYPLPALGMTVVLLPAWGMWRAITRYRLLALDPEVAYGSIISKMMDIVFIVDERGCVADVNQQALALLGTRRRDVVGHPVAALLADPAVLDEELGELEKSGRPSGRFSADLVPAHGEPVPFTLFCSPVRDAAGQAAGFVLVGHDNRATMQLVREIGERNRAEMALQGALDDLERERNSLRLRQDEMEREMDMARQIQRRLVPAAAGDARLACHYRPMHLVGGDLYDFIRFPLSPNLGLFISDVSGHGVPAALITSMVKSVLLQSGPYTPDPSAFLSLLNDFLVDQTSGNFVTAFYGVWDPATRIFTYANAGHNRPYLLVLVDGEWEVRPVETAGSGPPLALFDCVELARLGKGYTDNTLAVPPGAKLFLYTDGLLDALNTDRGDDAFSSQVLRGLLAEHAHRTPEALVAACVERIGAVDAPHGLEDDVCLVCLDTG